MPRSEGRPKRTTPITVKDARKKPWNAFTPKDVQDHLIWEFTDKDRKRLRPVLNATDVTEALWYESGHDLAIAVRIERADVSGVWIYNGGEWNILLIWYEDRWVDLLNATELKYLKCPLTIVAIPTILGVPKVTFTMRSRLSQAMMTRSSLAKLRAADLRTLESRFLLGEYR